MFVELNDLCYEDLRHALMERVKLAGGEHTPVVGMECQTGRLQGGQIAAFCAELKKYSEDYPMMHFDVRDRLHGIITNLDSGYYCSVVFIERPGGMAIMASPMPFDFGGTVDVCKDAAAVIAELYRYLEKEIENRRATVPARA